jgi:hypothetical protein
MFFRAQYSPSRRWTRQWWSNSVEVFTPFAHMKALGINISAGGMGMFAVANLPVGSEVEIEFEAPHLQKRHRIRGIIRHRALYLYGVEFVAKPFTALAPRSDNSATERQK